jgi:2-desacetyl-2-hydroxyethyl bacteriochlorophyllide A dehydrogenase
MKALVCTDVKTVQPKEIEIPDYKGKILIKVMYAGICGSDLTIFFGKHPRAKLPLILGHEFCGIVEDIGDGADTDLKKGDHVVVNPLVNCKKCRACLAGEFHVCRNLRLYGIDCAGGMAEYSAVGNEQIHMIPKNMPWDIAALVEPVAVALHGMRQLAPKYYGSVLVCGGGPMGIFIAQMLRHAGMAQVIISEVNPHRIARAEKMGFITINPKWTDITAKIMSLTDHEGVDVLVEASGNAFSASVMTALTAPKGKILILSVFKEPAAIDLRNINFNEQQLIGTRVYTSLDFSDAISYTDTHREELREVISHCFSLDEGEQAFQIAMDHQGDVMKVLFHCAK